MEWAKLAPPLHSSNNHNTKTKYCIIFLVTELTDEDEGYNSLTSRTAMEKQG